MPTATEALQLLVDRKFSVVPLHNPDMSLGDLPPHVRKRVDPAGKEYSERDIGKIPLVTGWKDEQKHLPTEAMTEKRWKEWPIANIAVVCGEVSDIFVVDADGEAPLGFMERLGIVPGLTLTAKTGRPNGYQFYFRWPGFEVSNSLGQIFAGLDIKGEGGYVVAPPSRHRLGVNYAWVDGVDEPMPAPEELLEIIRQATQRKARKALLPENELNRLLAGPIPDGERHNSAKTLFAHWIGIGMPERAIREAAYTWGQTVCKPPADNEHLQKIVTWALEQESSKRKNPEEPKMAREGDDFIFSWPDFGLRVVMKNLEEDRREVWAEVIIESEVTGRLSWGRLSLPSTSGRDQLRKKLEAIRNDINWVAVLENICFMATEAFREIGEPQVLKTSDVKVDNRDIVDGVIKLSEGTINILFADMASGKMLALDTLIPTPNGWTPMGALRIGDAIFNEGGDSCRVVGTYDGWAPTAYRLRFSDGTSVDACSEHQWLTYDILTRSAIRRRVGNRSGRALPPQSLPRQVAAIRTTEEIIQTLYYRSEKLTSARHSIPMCGPLDLPQADLPLDSYVLGLWLGDGHSAQAVLTTADEEMIVAVGEAGYPVHPRRQQGKARGYGILGLLPLLRSLGVLSNKHIPMQYLRASRSQRLALLQGLMDTDGYVGEAARTVEFTSTNETLARGVVELARSLGQKPVLHQGRATLYGKDCGPKYRITWSPTIQVFRLPRKAERLRLQDSPAMRLTHRRIVAAEPLPPQSMRCIQVDSPSGLFLAGDGMIPTHNSTLAEAIGIAVATGRPFPGIIIPKRKPLNTLYIDTENMKGDDFVLRRMALCKGLGIPEPENLWWFHPERPLMENRQRIKARMDQKNIEFVILDSLAAAAGTGPEKADAAIRMIQTLHYLGRTALVVAHLPKAMASNGNSGEARTAYGSIFNTAYPRTSWDISVTERTDDRLTVRILHKKINLGKMRRRAYLIFEFKGKGDIPDAILLSTASASQAEPPNTVIGYAPAGTIGTTSWWAKELGVDESIAKARLNDMRREGYVEPTRIGGGRGKQTEWVRTDKPWHETGREGASLDDGESVL